VFCSRTCLCHVHIEVESFILSRGEKNSLLPIRSSSNPQNPKNFSGPKSKTGLRINKLCRGSSKDINWREMWLLNEGTHLFPLAILISKVRFQPLCWWVECVVQNTLARDYFNCVISWISTLGFWDNQLTYLVTWLFLSQHIWRFCWALFGFMIKH